MDDELFCNCSKEPLGTVPISRVFDRLDSLFARNDMDGAGRLLEYWEREARALNDCKSLVEILNEEAGYYRKIQDKDKGLKVVDELLYHLKDMGDSVSSATIYLNCATTLKAFKKSDDAMRYYNKARDIYESNLKDDDPRLAGLYNNLGTALVDMCDYVGAKECYNKAIGILDSKRIADIAISYINLAHAIFDEAMENDVLCDDEIEPLLDATFNMLVGDTFAMDGKLAYVLSKCAPSFSYFGRFIESDVLFQLSKEIYENYDK